MTYRELAEISAFYVPNLNPLWILAQWCHETDGFTSELATRYNNYGGLTQIEPNDLPQPDGDCYYKKFSSALDYARYFGKYLLLYEADGIKQCESLSEYLSCLKLGGYYGDSYINYYRGVERWLAIIR